MEHARISWSEDIYFYPGKTRHPVYPSQRPNAVDDIHLSVHGTLPPGPHLSGMKWISTPSSFGRPRKYRGLAVSSTCFPGVRALN